MASVAERKNSLDTQQRIVEEIVGLRRRLKGLIGPEVSPGGEQTDSRIADRYRDLLGSLSEVVIEIDAAGCMAMVSPRARDLLAYEPTELTGKAFRELLCPEETARADRLLAGVIESGESMQLELCVRRGDGTDVQMRANVVCSGNDARAAALVILSDMSERERMADALRESEEKYRALFGTSPDSIAVLDLHGRVLDGNVFFGFPPDKVKGKHFKDLGVIPPEFVEHGEALWAAIASGERIGPVELQICDLTGTERWLEVYAAPVTKGDRPFAIQVISRDISDRKKLEEQLSQSQKMEAVGRLAGGVAHDFNNQLLVILNSAAILTRSLEPGDERLEKVELIRRAAERSVVLTRQLLAFSRKQMIEPAVLDLNRVLADLQPTLQRVVGDGVTVSYSLDEGLGRVNLDPAQVEQILINLAANARDAMPAGGALEVATANLSLAHPHAASGVLLAAGQYVTLSVVDSGSGMGARTLARIFEPFFTTKGPGNGTGLGLSTVYGMVKQSGGEIGVRSELGSGSAFTIYLPMVEGEPSVSAGLDAPAAEVPPGSRTVLLIEDNYNVRETTRIILEDGGYRVHVAPSAGHGLELFDRLHGEIDLVISDVVMPGMSMKELLQKMKGIEPEVKVLLVSGYSEQVVEEQGVARSGVRFLNKPFTLERLLGTVAEMLGER